MAKEPIQRDDYREGQRERFYSTLGIKKPKSKKERYAIARLCSRRRPDGGEASSTS
jgi:hypothetical protein